jgi:hypothetical protein
MAFQMMKVAVKNVNVMTHANTSSAILDISAYKMSLNVLVVREMLRQFVDRKTISTRFM